MSTTLTQTRRVATGPTRGGTQPRTRPVSGVSRPRPATTARRSRAVRAPRAPFVLLVVGLLGGGLISLLLLNTVLAQDAFALDALRKRTATLEHREQAMRQEVARAEAPQSLAQRARELGMEPAQGNAFVDIDRGKVVGGPSAGGPTSSAEAAER